MAYDEGLAERLRELFDGRPDAEEKKMFGGLCLMVSGHMCCGIVGDTLMARVGPVSYEKYLSKKHAKKMDFTGKPMKGMIYIEPDGIAEDAELNAWIEICLTFISILPPKQKAIKGLKL